MKNVKSNQYDPTRRDQQLSTNLEAASTFMHHPCTCNDVNMLCMIVAQVHVGTFVNGTRTDLLAKDHITRDSITGQQDLPPQQIVPWQKIWTKQIQEHDSCYHVVLLFQPVDTHDINLIRTIFLQKLAKEMKLTKKKNGETYLSLNVKTWLCTLIL